MKKSNTGPLVYTVEEIREILGLSRPMAYALVKQPGFPRLHIGRCVRIPKEMFGKWLHAQAQKAARSIEYWKAYKASMTAPDKGGS